MLKMHILSFCIMISLLKWFQRESKSQGMTFNTSIFPKGFLSTGKVMQFHAIPPIPLPLQKEREICIKYQYIFSFVIGNKIFPILGNSQKHVCKACALRLYQKIFLQIRREGLKCEIWITRVEVLMVVNLSQCFLEGCGGLEWKARRNRAET